MDILLNHHAWELKGFWPWVPSKGTSMEIGNELMGVTEWIPATVPGGVHEDLFQAGLIANPYQELNSLNCEWVENRWWVYRTSFVKPSMEGERIELVFKGLDYEAMIYLGGTLLGEHRGMFKPAVFDVTEALEGRDTVDIQVVLKHAPDEMGQIGKTSETFTQKSRFNYKWDFSTRLVNIGIWDDVLLRVTQAYVLEDIALHSDAEGTEGFLSLTAQVRAPEEDGRALHYQLQVTDPGCGLVALVQQPVSGPVIREKITVPAAQLWFPNGYGAQPLYTVTIKLFDLNSTYDQHTFRTGIRRLEYMQNEGSPEEALPYTFVINGEKIYIKGANVTPLDHLYGNVGPGRYEWMIRLAKTANLNMLRIWGGGIIEKSRLYELCDQHGLLIWQEFIQSSSGVDNIPSKKPEFLALLEETAVEALRTRRNHVSLTVWSGGNELMSAPNRPSTYEDGNLAFLKSLVEQHDPQRLFLPTSASGPVQYITREKGVSHDVHGHWKYQGNGEHYSIYGEADHLFHSEFGVDGLSSVKSLHKFLGGQHRTPVSMRDSLVWRHHGEWWDTYDRDVELFGEFRSLNDFAEASQWMQAEGLRYILEANRRRQFRNSGSIIWQLNEPWPNVSCTNLVDYYMEPKMAYYWVKAAFAMTHASLDYSRLDYEAGERFASEVYVHSRESLAAGSVQAEVFDLRGSRLLEQRFPLEAGACGSVRAGVLAFEVPETVQGLFMVRLSFDDPALKPNLYFFSTHQGTVYQPAFELPAAELAVEALGGWKTELTPGNGAEVYKAAFTVTNQGPAAALHIYPEESSDGFWMVADDAYFTLLPGESRHVTLTCTRRTEELFRSAAASAGTEGPAVEDAVDHVRPVVVFRSFAGGAVHPVTQQEQQASLVK